MEPLKRAEHYRSAADGLAEVLRSLQATGDPPDAAMRKDVRALLIAAITSLHGDGVDADQWLRTMLTDLGVLQKWFLKAAERLERET
jgi:hypothetical protein